MPTPGNPTITDLANGGQYFNAPIYDPNQMQQRNDIAQLGGQRLANPTQGYQPIAQNATRQFYQDTIPSLAERFTATGGNDRRSSAFGGALGQAGANLQSQLAAGEAQYGLQQQQLGLDQARFGGEPQYNQAYFNPQDNQFGAQLAGAGGDLARAYLNAPGSVSDKIKNVLGIGGASGAGSLAAKAASSGLIGGAAGTAANVAPAAATAATGGAATALGAGTAAGSGVATALGSAGAAAPAAAAALGWEAAIAPTLATAGAIAMPLVAIPLMGWIGYNIIKGIFFED